MASPRSDLLDALAMPLRAGEAGLSPTGALRGLLENRRTKHQREVFDHALLLAATYAQLLGYLQGDLGRLPEPGRKRFSTALTKGVAWLAAERLVFAPLPDLPSSPALGTLRFLASLPSDLVERLVRFAPPVVAVIPGQADRFAVLGNVLSGFLASRCLPGRTIAARQLRVATGPRWAATDFVAWGLPMLSALVDAHRDRIVELVEHLNNAESLTNLSRATAARIRQRLRRRREGDG